jgi:hypothetical protein
MLTGGAKREAEALLATPITMCAHKCFRFAVGSMSGDDLF